jgi:lipopolysaccharide-induced tumor necrosis factor-alpha factor
VEQPSSEVYHQGRQVQNLRIQQSEPALMMPPSTHYPESRVCPYCHQLIVTRIEKTNGLVVWLTSAGLCFFGFVLGCCLIPFCIDGIKV